MKIEQVQARTDVPVISVDHRGYVTAINDRFREAYGWEAADLVGRPLSTIIPTVFHEAHHLGFSRFLATGQPTLLEQPLQLKIVARDGREQVAEHYIVAEERDGAWAFAAMIRALG
jgi:PAS domain S-box-containing protein